MTETRVTLIGTGALAASLGLAWKAHAPASPVTGLDAPDVLEEAARRGALDAKAAGLSVAVSEADLVVLAAPLAASLRLVREMAPHLKPGALVTDVGAAKAPIAAVAREALGPENPFVGGHPLVEGIKGGAAAARADLFSGVPYVLCPPEEMDEAALREAYAPLVNLVEATGARFSVMPAERHDRLMALTRHVPRLLAATLAAWARDEESGSEKEHALFFSGSPLEALLREAAPLPSPDVLAGSQGRVLDALAGFAAALQKTRNRLAADDFDALADFLSPPTDGQAGR